MSDRKKTCNCLTFAQSSGVNELEKKSCFGFFGVKRDKKFLYDRLGKNVVLKFPGQRAQNDVFKVLWKSSSHIKADFNEYFAKNLEEPGLDPSEVLQVLKTKRNANYFSDFLRDVTVT